ncbi:MAG: FAD-dependent thymidylate synthase, partial [Vulcanimicrobiaceae bacterium]
LLDSISPAGARLTTMEVRYPRFVHSELMTHRVFSRNAASSRAVPVKKMIAAVRDDPAMPVWWGKNQSGMAARRELTGDARVLAETEWRAALANALATAERLSDSEIDLHKQLVNRIIEPFAWITVIVSATEWANFFTQRCHPDAQPEIKHVAEMMLAAYAASTPQALDRDEWHTPLVFDDERQLDADTKCRISVARCARVSYLTHDGARDYHRDLELYEKLMSGGANGHWSPTEHVAQALADPHEFSGNFRGWRQWRKLFAEESAATFPALALSRP